jgi:DHA1 family tetracycline resistance protein-like MFS transporter
MVFILTTVVLDALAGTITFPVMPQLLKSLTGGEMAQMSTVLGAMATTFAAMQLFSAPVQGALSDHFGRRPVILVSNLGLAIDSVLMALAPNLIWLFAALMISGVAAGSIAAANAYVADVTEPDQRAARFGKLTAAISVGGMAGFLIGGSLGDIDTRLPFWVAAGLASANLVYGLFVLPESLRPENRAKLTWRSVHPIGAVASIWRDYPILKSWQAALLLITFGIYGINSIFVLYVTFRFDWTPKTIGFYATFVMASTLAVQSVMVPRVVRWFGERRTLLTGFVIETVAVVATGLAVTGSQFTAGVFLMIVGGVADPVRLAIINRIIGPSDRGRLSGAERSILNINGVIAPTVFALMFAAVVGAGQHALVVGTPFFVCAALMIPGFAITVWSLNRSPTAADATR